VTPSHFIPVAKTGFMIHVLLMEQVSTAGVDLEGILTDVCPDALPKEPTTINTSDNTNGFNLMPP
jgi:hypothetical protein